MGAIHFLKLGGLELNSREARTFFKPPYPSLHIIFFKPSYPSPPILGGLDIYWGA